MVLFETYYSLFSFGLSPSSKYYKIRMFQNFESPFIIRLKTEGDREICVFGSLFKTILNLDFLFYLMTDVDYNFQKVRQSLEKVEHV
jgi:hypothetical protein